MIDWDNYKRFDWFTRLGTCVQDPIYHAEGDVLTHTKMVCEALIELPEYQALDYRDRDMMFWAALLHDVAKPETTRVLENGRVSAKNHSQKGATKGWGILYRLGEFNAIRRLYIAAMTKYHQVPFWLLDRDDADKLIQKISWQVPLPWLTMLAKADILGRYCPDQDQILENIEMFREYAGDLLCWDSAAPVVDHETRFEYVRGNFGLLDYPATRYYKSRVVLMMGFPGSGKDTLIQRDYADLPMVSLDDIRIELGVDPAGNQGRVVTLGKERAKEFLRKQQDFVWNATNLTKLRRKQLIDIFIQYGAHITLVFVDTPYARMCQQNQNRPDAVPQSVVESMIDRFDVPTCYEAHQFRHIIN